MEKSCARCHARLPYSSFYKKKGTADGLYGFCKKCTDASAKAYRQKNKEVLAITSAIKRDRTKTDIKEKSRRYYLEKSDVIKAKNRERTKVNPGSRKAYNAAWLAAHRDELRPYYAEKTRRRFAARLKATPVWADRDAIMAIYFECRRISEETGVMHHVDHIVPLVSPLVCGLHIEYNLQIMPAAGNLAKSNRFQVETF